MDIFSIPQVIRCILEHLETPQVAACRLVNTTWNYESCKILQSREIIGFRSCKEIEKYNETFSSSIDHISIRFESFQFIEELFRNAIEDNPYGYLRKLQDALQLFYKNHGKYVVTLIFTLIPIYRMADNAPHCSTVIFFTELFQMVFTHFTGLTDLTLLLRLPNPNLTTDFSLEEFTQQFEGTWLKSLSVEKVVYFYDFRDFEESAIPTISESTSGEMISFLAQKMISSAPNLHSIVVKDVTTGRCLQNAVFENLASKAIHRLSLSDRVSQSGFTKLLHLRDLVHFQSAVDEFRESGEGLQSFLIRFKDSLKSLHLDFSSEKKHEEELSILPLSTDAVMSRLEFMRIENYKGSVDWRLFPVLRRLTVIGHTNKIFGSLGQYLQQFSTTCPTCGANEDSDELVPWTIRELKISEWKENQLDNPNHLNFLNLRCCFFHHLSSLTLRNARVLPLSELFGKCRKLKELRLFQCEGTTDDAICGIRKVLLSKFSPVEVGSLRKDTPAPKIHGMVEAAKNFGLKFRDSPYVGNLQDLETLEIDCGEFGDSSILFGVALCHRLKSIYLQTRYLTWRAKKILETELSDLVKLTVKNESFSCSVYDIDWSDESKVLK